MGMSLVALDGCIYIRRGTFLKCIIKDAWYGFYAVSLGFSKFLFQPSLFCQSLSGYCL
jgi:hypothetical protein